MTTQNINLGIVKSLKNRISLMTEEDILDLNKSQASELNNVVIGICKECFHTAVWNESEKDVQFFHFYITNTKEKKLEGWSLWHNLNLKNRNQITQCFALFIAKKYNSTDKDAIFNVYQHQARTIFEGLGYFTVDNKDVKKFQGKSLEFYLHKEAKGIVFMPFIETIEFQKSWVINTSSINKAESSTINFVYIMHNRNNNYYKIGRSIKPEFREKTLQAEEPDIIILEKWEANSSIELHLHKKFKHRLIRGEWFKLTTNDLKEIKDYMTKILKK